MVLLLRWNPCRCRSFTLNSSRYSFHLKDDGPWFPFLMHHRAIHERHKYISRWCAVVIGKLILLLQPSEAYVFYLKHTMDLIAHLVHELGAHAQSRWPSFQLAIYDFKLGDFLYSTLQHEATRCCLFMRQLGLSVFFANELFSR